MSEKSKKIGAALALAATLLGPVNDAAAACTSGCGTNPAPTGGSNTNLNTNNIANNNPATAIGGGAKIGDTSASAKVGDTTATGIGGGAKIGDTTAVGIGTGGSSSSNSSSYTGPSTSSAITGPSESTSRVGDIAPSQVMGVQSSTGGNNFTHQTSTKYDSKSLANPNPNVTPVAPNYPTQKCDTRSVSAHAGVLGGAAYTWANCVHDPKAAEFAQDMELLRSQKPEEKATIIAKKMLDDQSFGAGASYVVQEHHERAARGVPVNSSLDLVGGVAEEVRRRNAQSVKVNGQQVREYGAPSFDNR